MSPFNKKLTPINGRLAAYATLAGAALAAPAIPSADATIVYSGIVNYSIGNNFDGLYINFVTGATGTSSGAVPGANFNPYNGGTGLQFFWNAGVNGGLSLDATTYATLAAGTPITSGNTFLNTTSTTATAAWRRGLESLPWSTAYKLGNQRHQLRMGSSQHDRHHRVSGNACRFRI